MSIGLLIKCLIIFVVLCIFTCGARSFQKGFDHFLQSRKCVKTDARLVTFGWLPVFFAVIAFAVLFLLFVLFLLIYDGMPVLEMLLAPFGYGLLAYVLAIPVQYILLYYPKLYIRDHTLYMKGFFTRKAIPFEELQKGRRLMKPFFFKGRCYLKLEQGSIFISPDKYWGGVDFLRCLFSELGWNPILPYGEPSDPPHALTEKALYEMLVKEQELLAKEREIRSNVQAAQDANAQKSPGIWHNRG